MQGVFYRDSARRKALEAGVAGWVLNRGDGGVEAVLEGRSRSVDRVIEFLRDGPPRAEVSEIQIGQEEEPEGLAGFEVR